MGSKKRRTARHEKVSVREGRRHEGYLLLGKGVSKAEISRKLGVDYTTVVRWQNRRSRLGTDSWRDLKIPGRRPKLSNDQLKELRKILKKNATSRGYPTDLWTLKRVAEVIEKEFGVELSIPQVWRVLRALGFSPQVPQILAKERNDAEIRRWVLNEWPKIVLRARRTNATLVFLDESCVQSRPNVRRTWAPEGSRPVMRVKEGERDKLSLISAVTAEGELYFNIHGKDIASAEVLVFLDHLLREIPGKILLLWDSGGIHRSREVKAFLWENRKRLYTKRFPVYAPDYNPDEAVWNVSKYQDLSNWCPNDVGEMRMVVSEELEGLKRDPARLREAMKAQKLPLPVNGYLGRGWRDQVRI